MYRQSMKIARAPRKARSVTFIYENPAVEGRTGKLASRSVTLTVDGREVKLHSLVAVAKELDLTPMRVLQLVKERQLAAHRVGRDWVVLDQDLRQFKAQRRQSKRERN